MGAMRARFDPHETGGAPLLGVNGVAIIAHGSSNGRAIRNAVRAAADEALVKHVNVEIVEILNRSQPAAAAKPAGKGIRALFSRMRERLHRHPRESEAPGAPETSVETNASNHAGAPAEPAWGVDPTAPSPMPGRTAVDGEMAPNGTRPHDVETHHAEGESKPVKNEPS